MHRFRQFGELGVRVQETRWRAPASERDDVVSLPPVDGRTMADVAALIDDFTVHIPASDRLVVF